MPPLPDMDGDLVASRALPIPESQREPNLRDARVRTVRQIPVCPAPLSLKKGCRGRSVGGRASRRLAAPTRSDVAMLGKNFS
ncbi:hypothetical protein F8B43_0194 [Methylorubrum populi]|uniref:Uncharacterized protein n=1 Tax=Methylorubrum populi TaxID=223967 RepID=A0A833JA77_9HYPH|nr:hypothetical protein F8B43_0194 [Methylorubrum populi]